MRTDATRSDDRRRALCRLAGSAAALVAIFAFDRAVPALPQPVDDLLLSPLSAGLLLYAIGAAWDLAGGPLLDRVGPPSVAWWQALGVGAASFSLALARHRAAGAGHSGAGPDGLDAALGVGWLVLTSWWRGRVRRGPSAA